MDDFDEKSDSKHGEDGKYEDGCKADSKADGRPRLSGLEVLLKVEEYFYGKCPINSLVYNDSSLNCSPHSCASIA